MEEIHQAAQFYYETASHEEKEKIRAKFNRVDMDGDGRISKQEFLELMKTDMQPTEASWLFDELDRDGSGSLEFNEFKTSFYASISRPFCDCCSVLVEGLYYCCVRCWEKHMSDGHGLQPFRLCRNCCSNKLFEHDHNEFWDNYMLLIRSKEKLEAKREKKLKDNPDLKAGYLYYQALSDKEKNAAYSLFAKIDSNGDDKVSVSEVIKFLTDEGIPQADACKLFEGTGMTGDCDLSFEDVGALWYIFVTRPSCDKCRAMIMGMYYSCVECHNMSMNGADTDPYDLCPECYSSGDFQHEHKHFLDNFLIRLQNQLLRRGTATSSYGGGQGREGRDKLSKRQKLEILAHAVGIVGGAFGIVGTAIAVTAAAGVACSIM